MKLLDATWLYGVVHRHELWDALKAHVTLCAAALAIACAVAVSLGVLSAHHRYGSVIVSAMNGARVVPSLAVLTFVLPVLGLGFAPSLVALTLLACPPVLINTDLGLRGVDAAAREAAYGMGMRPLQVLRRVEAPLAMPVILAGVRTAAVEVIASATLATFIGGGGLGDFIVRGLENDNLSSLLLGAICVALLALSVEITLATAQRFVSVG